MRPFRIRIFGIALLFLLVGLTGRLQAQSTPAGGTACVNGMAAGYPCAHVNLLAHLELTEIGASDGTVTGNDHWGWTDPSSGRQFVIFGLSNGTSFVEITDPLNPAYLGFLPTHEGTSNYRDIKVYQNHAFIIADLLPNHGLQVFDLSQLLSVNSPPVTFGETAHFDGFGPGHNMWINETTGYGYIFRTDTCTGTYMVDLATPDAPAFAGCFPDDGQASDAQCVVYAGPDADYSGRELCFTGSDDTWTIADVTDKNNPVQVDSLVYAGLARAHQGTLTEDHRYWILSDTMDEATNGHNTRIYVWDLLDIDAPQYLGFYEYGTSARDHNIYVNDGISYQTNWRAGLQILDLAPLPSLSFTEIGYFDIVPDSNSVDSTGAWSNFPWWGDDIVTVSGTQQGLFILQTDLPTTPTDVALSQFSNADTAGSIWTWLVLSSLVFFPVALWWRRNNHNSLYPK